MDNGTAAAVATTPGPIGKERRPSSNAGSINSAISSEASGGQEAVPKKRHHRSQSGIKSLVEYTSEVSSEDFSGPEDGEVDSDGGRNSPQNHQRTRRPPPPPRTPPLVANASPINDDEDIDLGMFLGLSSETEMLIM